MSRQDRSDNAGETVFEDRRAERLPDAVETRLPFQSDRRLFDPGENSMNIHRFPIAQPQCRCRCGTAGADSALFVQNTRPAPGEAEPVADGAAFPLENVAVIRGEGLAFDTAGHSVVFLEDGLYWLEWRLPLSAGRTGALLVTLEAPCGRLYGVSGSEGGDVSGSALVAARRATALRLYNRSGRTVLLHNLADAGASLFPPARGYAGSLTVMRV